MKQIKKINNMIYGKFSSFNNIENKEVIDYISKFNNEMLNKFIAHDEWDIKLFKIFYH